MTQRRDKVLKSIFPKILMEPSIHELSPGELMYLLNSNFMSALVLIVPRPHHEYCLLELLSLGAKVPTRLWIHSSII